MKVQVNRILAPVTVLGHGRRLGLWVQGCQIACPGCASVDTWATEAGETWKAVELADVIADEVVARALDGITLTGGEPTDQAPALASLVSRVRERLVDADYGIAVDILMFSGRPARAAARRAEGLWELLDAAVCGPYQQEQPGTEPLLATSNQELVTLSDLGASRYPMRTDTPRMQVVGTEDQLTLVGLPRPGDLERLEARLGERGVSMGGASWRPVI